jgi:hypothetical protein
VPLVGICADGEVENGGCTVVWNMCGGVSEVDDFGDFETTRDSSFRVVLERLC